jgi:membrane-bound ClpP family serine protease
VVVELDFLETVRQAQMLVTVHTQMVVMAVMEVEVEVAHQDFIHLLAALAAPVVMGLLFFVGTINIGVKNALRTN